MIMKESMSQRVERKYPGKKRVIDAASGRRDADFGYGYDSRSG